MIQSADPKKAAKIFNTLLDEKFIEEYLYNSKKTKEYNIKTCLFCGIEFIPEHEEQIHCTVCELYREEY